MTRDQIDVVWQQAMHDAIAEGEQMTRYRFAEMISAIQRQAEPAQKPVAWMCPDDPERETAFHWQAGHCDNCGKQRIPLYTAPPQRKPLTDEEEE